MPTVVLTGATRGIGAAAAVQLASQGAEVALVGRDATRVREAAEAARAAAGNGVAVHEHVADLASMAEVRRLADELKAAHPRIDVLANNAGAVFTSRHTTPDGFEQTFALNHLAAFLLTNLLLDRLSEARGRVVTTSSDNHTSGKLDFGDLQAEHGRYKAGKAYGTSKLCNVLFTRELQRRHPELAVNCFHPGVVRTGFGRNNGALMGISMRLIGPFLRSPERGAEPLVWLALAPDAAQLHGQYLEKLKPATPSAAARDDALAAALWERSEELVSA